MTDAEKLQAILNLSCVVMSRSVTPARRERAICLLEGLIVEVYIPKHAKTWFQLARESCPNWRDI